MRGFAGILISCAALAYSTSASATLVEIYFSGSSTNTGGDVDYPPDRAIFGSFIYDSDIAMASPVSPYTFGEQQGMHGNSGLISATMTTPLGTISFSRSPENVELLRAYSIQSQLLSAQNFSSFVMDIGRDLASTGPSDAFSGSIDGLYPYLMGIELVSDGLSTPFFDDPAAFLSGASDIDLTGLVVARISAAFTNGQDTRLAIESPLIPAAASALRSILTMEAPIESIGIRILDGDPPSEVPLPGALLLMLSGLVGIGFTIKRR